MMKRYYWLKLQNDFFKRHDIRIIEEMPNGKDYILFYLKLLVESISHDGHLRFNEMVPYDEKMLSVITNTNIDIVRAACKLFSSLHLMEKLDDGTLFMTESQRMIGNESESRERVMRYRERKKQLNSCNVTCNGDVTKSNAYIDIEIEKETEIKTDQEKEKMQRKQKWFSPPTLEDFPVFVKEESERWITHIRECGFFKTAKPNLNDYCAAIDKLLRIDNLSEGQIVSIREYLERNKSNGGFSWTRQIGSPAKLREKSNKEPHLKFWEYILNETEKPAHKEEKKVREL